MTKAITLCALCRNRPSAVVHPLCPECLRIVTRRCVEIGRRPVALVPARPREPDINLPAVMIMDAIRDVAGEANNPRRYAKRYAALRWLFRRTDGFDAWMRLAGCNSDVVQAGIRRQLRADLHSEKISCYPIGVSG